MDPFSGENLSALLGRPLRRLDVEGGERELTRARVLVTGAAGSVGRALVRRLLAYQPETIAAIDNHEASLFHLARDAPPDAPLELRVADVRNETKMRRILSEVRPQVVFHLAAYKHVPFGEREADEPVSVNVLGTSVVTRCAAEAGVRHLVYPSSDKAVNPPSVYGATKRLAEAILLDHAAASPLPAIHIVRYVNIVGSSGSVLETFAQQAQHGQPMTLTDERMTRYWMAMDEGTDLLIHALSLPSRSRTLLDVGAPVPVKEMAERLCRLVRADGSTPDFVVTGARPGERLAEELTSESEYLRRQAEGVLSIESEGSERRRATDGMLKELRELLDDGDTDNLRVRVMELARELQ